MRNEEIYKDTKIKAILSLIQSGTFKTILEENNIYSSSGEYAKEHLNWLMANLTTMDEFKIVTSNLGNLFQGYPVIILNSNIDRTVKLEILKKYYKQKDLPKYASILGKTTDANNIIDFIESTIIQNNRVKEKQRGFNDIIVRIFIGNQRNIVDKINYDEIKNFKELIDKYKDYFKGLLNELNSLHKDYYNLQSNINRFVFNYYKITGLNTLLDDYSSTKNYKIFEDLLYNLELSDYTNQPRYNELESIKYITIFNSTYSNSLAYFAKILKIELNEALYTICNNDLYLQHIGNNLVCNCVSYPYEPSEDDNGLINDYFMQAKNYPVIFKYLENFIDYKKSLESVFGSGKLDSRIVNLLALLEKGEEFLVRPVKNNYLEYIKTTQLYYLKDANLNRSTTIAHIINKDFFIPHYYQSKIKVKNQYEVVREVVKYYLRIVNDEYFDNDEFVCGLREDFELLLTDIDLLENI